MSPLCIGFLHDFCWFFAFVFSSGCVYLCSHLPCTFAGWIPILDFYLAGFSSSLSPSRTTIAHHIPLWNRPGVESTFPPWNDLKKCTMSPLPSSFVWPTGCRPRKQAGRSLDHTGALCSLCQIMPWQLGHYNLNLGCSPNLRICTRCTWYNALLLPVHYPILSPRVGWCFL